MSQPSISRRAVLHGGFAALGIGLLRSTGVRLPGVTASASPASMPNPRSHPILDIAASEPSLVVDGVPVARWWTADDWPGNAIPFHQCENCFEGGVPPEPTEEVEVAVIGGGLSGLCSAYLLRDRDVVLFEMRDRFGGNCMGERWRDVPYSLGSAYFITPDGGTFLDRIYSELGVGPDVVVDKGQVLNVELNGEVVKDFLSARGLPPEEQAVFQAYADLVAYHANEAYPEIPLPAGRDNEWILELDRMSLRQHIEERLGTSLPPLLAAAVQAYCYSSFGVGWDRISAAAGWNFLAAEEFGRWVLPGGNAGLAAAFWEKLRDAERESRFGRRILRPNSMTVDVRLTRDERVQVTWRNETGELHSLLARHAVMANSKHIAKYMLPDLGASQRQAFDGIETAAYAVVNVLLDEPSELPFYDIFLLGDGNFPMDETSAEARSAVVDVLNGEFAADAGGPATALTLYWPLPFPSGLFTMVLPGTFENYTQSIVPQVKRILDVLDVPATAIHQIRISRWGHAMPIAAINAIASGRVDRIRAPIEERIWFVNQDNWVLPAVENSLIEAETWTDEIRRRLDGS